MASLVRTGRRILVSLIVLATVLFVVALSYGYLRLRASRPRLTGTAQLKGLGAAVTIERDGNGVPTIVAEREVDLVRAVGFVHAQERFFQMDLSRRAGAGELAALLGPSVVAVDRSRRVHRFRHRAREAMQRLSPEDKALLEAYAAGVQAGLADRGVPPFEYDLLGVEPEPWRPEDTFCVSYAMFFTLQDASGQAELRRMAIERALPPGLAALVLSPGSEWDAPIDGSTLELPGLPSPSGDDRPAPGPVEPAAEPVPGSNNWAVSGAHSVHGGAMVADDMHLSLRMPNTWFRTRQQVAGPNGFDVTGVTLPGTPIVVAGSNGRVAWGFTNAYVDTSDLVVLEPGPKPGTYRTPNGPKALKVIEETIEVRGGEAETLQISMSEWGPVIAQDFDGRDLALRWTAHDEGGNDLGLRGLMLAKTLEDALRAAHDAGMPNQNVTIAAADGRIAWTLSGLIPVRPEGCDGARPTSWADGRCAWQGYAAEDRVPRVVDPPSGRLWTANNRIVGPEERRAARYREPALGARAKQIRDGLMAKDKLSEADLLAIQLDDRAVFLEPWRGLMLSRLEREDRAAMREAVENWGGHAAVDSVGYRAVKTFREATLERVVDPILAPARAMVEQSPNIDVHRLRPQNVEHFAWTVLTARPAALLPEGASSWDEVLDRAIDDVQRQMDAADGGPERFTWGARNRLGIEHPLSSAVPILGRLLNPPSVPVPGDRDMPRVQSPTHGASERFVVSPGREAEGIFHMPSGQASHPLSPYLHAGHQAWVEGQATPFLPGSTEWTLQLTP